MPFTEQSTQLEPQAQRSLLRVALRSIDYGIASGRSWRPRADDYPEGLRRERASFVTLENSDGLRGCIGLLEARRPLVVDVAKNAFSAAFEDPRFPPLTRPERDGLEVHISVLSSPEPLAAHSREDLLAQIRPGVDGLIIEDQGCRGTFLPSVWDQLAEPASFLAHLLAKAGLPPAHWSGTLKVWRYATQSFGSPVAGIEDTA